MYLQNIVCVAPVLHSQIVRTNIVTNIDTHTQINTQGENIITSLMPTLPDSKDLQIDGHLIRHCHVRLTFTRHWCESLCYLRWDIYFIRWYIIRACKFLLYVIIHELQFAQVCNSWGVEVGGCRDSLNVTLKCIVFVGIFMWNCTMPQHPVDDRPLFLGATKTSPTTNAN